jgi:hypothetical protein
MGESIQKRKWIPEYDNIIREFLQKDGGFDMKKMMELTNLSRTTIARHTKKIADELQVRVNGLYTADYVEVVAEGEGKTRKPRKPRKVSKLKEKLHEVKVAPPEHRKWMCKCKCKEDGKVVFLSATALSREDAKKFVESNYNVYVIDVLTHEEHISRRDKSISFGVGRLSTARRVTNEMYRFG